VVNPPLASTAVGAVAPQRAGMASGINSTFRQVGTATGIALLGTLFSNDVKTEVLTRTAAVPGLSARGPEIAGAVQSGQSGGALSAAGTSRAPRPAVRKVPGHIRKGNPSEYHPNRAARQAREALGPGDRPGSLPTVKSWSWATRWRRSAFPPASPGRNCFPGT
jgi:hypothetical protein